MNMNKPKLLPPVHPGEVLLEDFIKPLGLSQYRVAKDLGVSQIAVSQIVHSKRGLSAEMVLRLARYTGTSIQFWSGLQAQYDVEVTRRAKAKEIEEEVDLCPLLRKAA